MFLIPAGGIYHGAQDLDLLPEVKNNGAIFTHSLTSIVSQFISPSPSITSIIVS